MDQSEKGQKVELFFACRNLSNLDGVLGKSDPLIKVYLNETELGKTEHIKDSLNPDFKKSIDMHYAFEQRQPLTVKVFDVDGEEANSNF
jgi:copine 5/8/9